MVASFALSCSFLVYVVVTACLVSRKGFGHHEIESLIIIDDLEQSTVKRMRKESLQENDTIQNTCGLNNNNNNNKDNDNAKVSDNESADLCNVYNEPSQEAQKLYGPVMIR